MSRLLNEWRIKHVELSFKDRPALLDVDGRTLEVEGRIDRIDFNESTGQYAVFDYKTGDSAKPPDKVHRETDGRWIDLQLPLYRLLLASMGIPNADLGYILLPRDPGGTGLVMAEWTEAELGGAMETARRVVADIWGGKFDMAVEPPKFDDFADICGVDRLVSAMVEEEE